MKTKQLSDPILDTNMRRVINREHHDPFEILGLHLQAGHILVRVLLPDCESVTIDGADTKFRRLADSDIFECNTDPENLSVPYQLRWWDRQGQEHLCYDPYCFPPQISEKDLQQFNQGEHIRAWQFLGAHYRVVDGVQGVLFSTWAPNASSVSVVGDFNQWDGRRHPMRCRGPSGIWELFLPDCHVGALYKFEIKNRSSGRLHTKADPFARCAELRPKTASVVTAQSDYLWQDDHWYQQDNDWQHTPISIYEVHLGSWRLHEDARFLSYRELAHELIPHVKKLGFTHIELLPITEHPFDASWGYQATGFFAPTARFGCPDDLRYFVDCCHQANIGVLLDWVPGHFPKDDFALANYDGTALFEHEDPRLREHPEWGTLQFNFARHEVKSFLISSALYWLEQFHFDGLRVDAVASMLYLDYAREAHQWLPNAYGGNENLDAVSFLQQLNYITHTECPRSVTIAEESTSWPQVTRPTYVGGLGFSMKWNMGWMHDTLDYCEQDPIYRHYHHQSLTFGLLYAYSENFILPFSHDEVVHGKGSLLNKMPGDNWQQLANLRLLLSYQFTYPGKKLLFMGTELASREEWNERQSLDWSLASKPSQVGLQLLISDLNKLYCSLPPLHYYDFDTKGFKWIDCHDASQSIISYLREAEGNFVVVILNFTPVIREAYCVGVPTTGPYRELLNSDAACYGGSNVGNGGIIQAKEKSFMGFPCHLSLTLPPLGCLILQAHHDD